MVNRPNPNDDNQPESTVTQPGNGPGASPAAKKVAANKFRKLALMNKVKKNKPPKLKMMQ